MAAIIETFEDRALLASFSFSISEQSVVNGVLQGGGLSADFEAIISWRKTVSGLGHYTDNPDSTAFVSHTFYEEYTIPNGGSFEAPHESYPVGSMTFPPDRFDRVAVLTEGFAVESFSVQLRNKVLGEWIVLNNEGSVPKYPVNANDPFPSDPNVNDVVFRVDLYRVGTFAGLVYDDHDRSGELDETFQAVVNQRIELRHGSEVLDVDFTDDTGNYNLRLGARNRWTYGGGLPISLGPAPSAELSVVLVSDNATQTSTNLVRINTDVTASHVGVFRETTVSGQMYSDRNGNGQKDAGEPIEAGLAVFIDRNLDGLFTEADQPVDFENPVFTDIDGNYTITYDGVGVVRTKSPTVPASLFSVVQGQLGYSTLSGTPLTNANFGLFQNAVVGGHVYLDVNGNGRRDLPGDVAATGLTIQLDNGNDGSINHTTTVNAQGNYSFVGVPRGPFRISLAPQAGTKQTQPTSLNGHVGTVTTYAQGIGPLDIGVQRGKDVSVSDATFDGKTIKFKYGSTQITSPFNVAFYQSSDATFDSSDRKLELTIQIDPQTGGEHGNAQYDLREPYKHDPTKPFILVVADPAKTITETSETNNILKATRVIDIGPLKAVGSFQYDPTTDRFKANGTITIGYKPETAEPFFPLVTVNGEVSYDSKTIYSTGLVTATVGAFSAPLFSGKWNLGVADQTSTLLKPTGLIALVVAGLGVNFHSLKLVNPKGGLTLDSFIEITGKVSIPGTAQESSPDKPLEIEFTAENPLRLKSDGPSLLGKIILPQFKFELFGMEIETESVSLEYFHPRRAFRMQGKVTLKKLLPGFLGDRGDKVVADFADTNYLEYNHLGFAGVGSISVDKLVIFKNSLELRNLKFSFNTVNHEWRGESEIRLKYLPGNTTLIAGLGFRDAELNFISLGADHLNIPLPLTSPTARLIVLQKVQVQLDNLADVDPNSAEFGTTIGVSDSFELTPPVNPPEGIIDLLTGPLFRLDITGKFSLNHIVGAGEITISHKDFINITGLLEMNWQEIFNPASVNFSDWQRLVFKAKGTVKALKGAVEGKFDATFASDLSAPTGTRSITASGEVTFKFTDSQKESLKARLPEWVTKRIIDRSLVGKANLSYVFDNSDANDYLIVYGDALLPVVGRKTIGFRAGFNGSFEWLTDLVDITAASSPAPEAMSDSPSGFAGLAASSAASNPANEFTVGAGKQSLLLAASWENDVGDVPLEVVDPNGNVIAEADFSTAGIAVLTDFSTRTSKALGISAPAAGTWIVRAVSEEGLGEIVYEGAHEGTAPNITLTSVTRDGSNVTINYSAADADSDATVRFFYDTDGEGFDGVPFGGNVAETDGTGSTTWDVTNLPAGTYHVYASIDDGQNVPVFAYAETPVVVEALPTSITGVVFEDSDASGVRDDGEQPLANWIVFLDANDNGVLDNPTSGNNVADAHATEVWTTSNASGEYSFANVALGEHTLAVVNQTGFVPTFVSDNEPLLVVIREDNPQLEIDLGHDRLPPVITSLSQTAVIAGSVTGSDFLTLTIRGTGFVTGSPNPVQTVEVNTPADPDNFVGQTTIIDSPTQMRVLIPADQLATPRTAKLRINHTDVGLSNAFDLIVSSNVVSISPTSASNLEGNSATTPFTFTVSRTGDTSESATLDYVVSGSGTNAASTDDFNGLFPIGTVTFAPGQTSQVITIDVSGDTDVELAETFDVRLTNAVGTAIVNSNATGTINNDDTSFTIAVAAPNASKSEGNTGSTPFTFTVTRNGVTTGTGSVKFAVTGSGANPAVAADFGSAFPTGTVNFLANETSKTITVNAKAETLFEADEAFAVTLNTPIGGVLGTTASATATILNDDTAVVIAATDAGKPEGTGTTPTSSTFTITRLGNLNVSSSVKYAVAANGSGVTAAAATDFSGGKFPSGVATFAPGEATKLITIPVIADATLESNESFKVTLSSPVGTNLGAIVVVNGTIQNDDSVVSIAATSANKSEGTTDSTPFTFTVTRTGDTTDPASVNYAVTGATKNGADVTDFGEALPSGTVEFATNETSKLITINVIADTIGELNEGFVVTLSDPVNTSLGKTTTATGTIINDDTSFSITPASATSANKAEGSSTSNPLGNTAFTFLVTRIGLPVVGSVQFAVNGSGDNPADADDFANATLRAGTLTFAANKGTQTVTINVRADRLVEANEGFTVTLANPTGATLVNTSANGTIVNDDTTFAIAATEAMKSEGNTGLTAFTFTVTRDGVTTGTASVKFAVIGTLGANPTIAADFGTHVPASTVSFAAGETTKLITINVKGDTTVEPDEGFTVTLFSPSTGATILIASALGTILNDD